jgi:pimeloyl-ACP methyl ester carboxylesterase
MKPSAPISVSAVLRRALTIAVFAALGTAWGQSPPASTETLVSRLGPGFTSRTMQVNGTSVHYVRGGSGPAIILIHGFPQDWYEFRKVLPRLAQKFTVVAVDLRGVGDSAPANSGYDAANLAEDIHQLATHLSLEKPYIFGHDIGGMVAYAYARRCSNDARGVMILDVAFPGLDPWHEMLGNRDFWHIRFHQTDLPEKLVTGRQAEYFGYFLSPDRFSAEDLAHFANAYRDPDHLSAAFATYRAFPADEKFFSSETSRLNLPLVIGSGESDAFAPYLPRIADALRAHGISNLKIEIVPGSAHYVANEQPDLLASLIEKYAAP